MNKGFLNADKLKKVFTSKGFYILLALCLGVMAASAYVSYNQKQADEMLKQALEKDNINYSYSYEADVPTMAQLNNTMKPKATMSPTTKPMTSPPTAPTTSPSGTSPSSYEPRGSITNPAEAEASVDTPTNAELAMILPDESSIEVTATIDANVTLIEPQQSAQQPIMPAQGEVTQEFAADDLVFSKTMQDWRTHYGVDIKGDIGTQVKATMSGVVEKVYTDDMKGVTVIISHPGNYKSYYSNLQPGVVVEEGQSVAQGDVIGGIGMSAAFEIGEPPHLHFELHEGGSPVNAVALVK